MALAIHLPDLVRRASPPPWVRRSNQRPLGPQPGALTRRELRGDQLRQFTPGAFQLLAVEEEGRRPSGASPPTRGHFGENTVAERVFLECGPRLVAIQFELAGDRQERVAVEFTNAG